jgi:hypothetical protein
VNAARGILTVAIALTLAGCLGNPANVRTFAGAVRTVTGNTPKVLPADHVAYTCPWAHRALIFRALKKLENAIMVAYALSGMRGQGWMFENHSRFPEIDTDAIYLRYSLSPPAAAFSRGSHPDENV